MNNVLRVSWTQLSALRTITPSVFVLARKTSKGLTDFLGSKSVGDVTARVASIAVCSLGSNEYFRRTFCPGRHEYWD